jgi:hypothetical protein
MERYLLQQIKKIQDKLAAAVLHQSENALTCCAL